MYNINLTLYDVLLLLRCDVGRTYHRQNIVIIIIVGTIVVGALAVGHVACKRPGANSRAWTAPEAHRSHPGPTGRLICALPVASGLANNRLRNRFRRPAISRTL